MSETIIPDVPQTSDVLEAKETVIEETAAPQETPVEEPVNLAEKTLAELVELFGKLKEDVDKMKKSKEAEAIKSAFYKKLIKEKVEAGVISEPDAAAQDAEAAEAEEAAPQAEEVSRNPFQAIELAFKDLYNSYKKERAEFNKAQEKEREDNLAAKEAVIEDLKELVEKQEDVNATFPAFREIQSRWRAIGPVPAQQFRDINDRYQYYVEKFYDMVKINRDLRDLDFKKNLEAKEAFCAAAEKLAENENVVEAFRELQKLHEQWKEFGPVAKEFRDDIWNRFKASTAVINKKYQGYFEGLKEKQGENLVAKTALCEKVEEIAAREVTSSNEWNALSKEIEKIQAEWKTIGFAAKKENQKIYERFRAACDKFFEKKRDFYSQYKDSMNENLDKKMALIEAAEALKNSTEWKKATDEFINLQKQWKEIGAVPRKKSEQLWKKFRGACDEFFAERDKQAKPENDFYGNLKAKKALVEEINAYVSVDEASDEQAMKEFAEKWKAIGFVPFKEKEAIAKAFKEAMQAKFPSYSERGPRRIARPVAKAPRSAKEILIQKYNTLQQDIVTFENNIGFFSLSKNAEPLINQMKQKIEDAKQELKALEEKIRNAENEETTGNE
ncbi:MAG: DUF349 domain-containing protein [Bacteroidales bacterium]|nr:DUF349 domain-containing protein [Candidatus Cryptobacteroides onthequi]